MVNSESSNRDLELSNLLRLVLNFQKVVPDEKFNCPYLRCLKRWNKKFTDSGTRLPAIKITALPLISCEDLYNLLSTLCLSFLICKRRINIFMKIKC